MSDGTAASLRRAFDESFAAPARPAAEEVERLLAIRVAGHPYALRLAQVAELVRERKVVPVPSSSEMLLGLAGIRGEIVPVFSLAALLDHPPEAGPSRWMVLCAGEDPVALAFSEFEGYLRAGALHPVVELSPLVTRLKEVPRP